jgi:hypothetical protein
MPVADIAISWWAPPEIAGPNYRTQPPFEHAIGKVDLTFDD